MSVLGEYPEVINNKKDVQIWNNSAFDDGGDPEGFNSYNQMKSPSWLMKKPVTVNQSSDSLDSSFSSKENQSPIGFSKPSVLVHSLNRSKPFNNHPIKIGSNVLENLEKTDEEIEIENEINRLLAKLESIRADKNARHVEKQGKSVLIAPDKKKESRNKIQRRGFSLGPNEIMSATHSKSKQSGTTPIQSSQNRRKSCFWKLDDIEEERSRNKNPSLRHAVTTIGTRKGMKKDDSVLTSIQPKKLFGEQSVPAKKPIKPGRIVPSRYNQATVNSLMKKRDNVEPKSRGGTEGRVKKKWDISNVVIPKRLNLDANKDENENSVDLVDVVIPEVLLPKIRVVRYAEESGRDSGRAKRVAELVGKKSYFDEEAVCQKLSFDED
ncbi:hypothetical protein E3N88_27698 [Mikania micrantha]|uniref:Uncharacterized protein n=1 Tax=Mikania micrantha TaxID=192012 RepID=A0A5N6MYI2_9ASTR|nr:hypothetical protein E3N88_27698 [Mikania micrantha]